MPHGGLLNRNKGKLPAWLPSAFIRIRPVIKDAELAPLEVASQLRHKELILPRPFVRAYQVIAADVHLLLLRGQQESVGRSVIQLIQRKRRLLVLPDDYEGRVCVIDGEDELKNAGLAHQTPDVFVLLVVLETACAFWQALLSGAGNTFRSDWSFKRLASDSEGSCSSMLSIQKIDDCTIITLIAAKILAQVSILSTTTNKPNLPLIEESYPFFLVVSGRLPIIEFNSNLGMSLSKEGYVPSKLTLTCMDNFGLKTRKHKLSKANLALARSQSKLVPSFAGKPRSAFDKENLLEQLRQEKRKHREMTASNGMLRRQLSNPKQPAPPLTITASAAVVSETLKREIELLVQQSEEKEREIQKIKTSKKYNRFIELQSAKQVYLDQIKTVSAKISKTRTSLRQQKRILRDFRRRQKDVAAMNKEVECNIVRANNELLDRLEGIDREIRMGLQKEIEQRRQKSKLLQEIMELQQKTGKVYIVDGKEEDCEEPFEFQKDAILKDVTEKYDDSSSSLSQEDSSQEYQVSGRRLNVSY